MKKVPEKVPKIFYCKKCDYTTSRKSQWTRHKMTAKHKNGNNGNDDGNEKSSNFFCENCGNIYRHKSGLSRHLKTCKIALSQLSKSYPNYPKVIHSKFVCECGKSYKYPSGLSKHRKICKKIIKDENVEITLAKTNNVEILLKSILEENKELREEIKNMKMGNTYNTQNNQYNINMFLNEKCKNAMNLEDFVEKIKLTLEDLQYTNKNGYANGISNIFIKNLSDMDVTERPIHCSDQKRLQFYVKNADEWSKDENNEKIDSSIQKVSQKQLTSINEWTKTNPDFMENDKKRDEYMEMVNKAIQPNDKKNLRSIKRKLGENVKI